MTIEYFTTKREWDGKTVYIIGGGPSLKGYDLSVLKSQLTIGVNDCAFHCGTDVLFSLDRTWMNQRYRLINEFKGDKYLAVSSDFLRLQDIREARYLYRSRKNGVNTPPNTVNGLNSGYGALNLAFINGAKTIYLLGFDMGFKEKMENHWHAGYPWCRTQSQRRYDAWALEFNQAEIDLSKNGIMVYNCSEDSRINCFPKVNLQRVLDDLSICS